MKKYTSGCALCGWSGEFDTRAERKAANQEHYRATKHGVIGMGEVPDDLLREVNATVAEEQQ